MCLRGLKNCKFRISVLRITKECFACFSTLVALQLPHQLSFHTELSLIKVVICVDGNLMCHADFNLHAYIVEPISL